ncbi:hypothetical protein [Actinoplanes subglobosus]|uniref:Uncharacterized protein n=1 Tax=Actinoplanes subglobosus TaxID=1547892 RepID=A0ABV8IVS2_9ACTN
MPDIDLDRPRPESVPRVLRPRRLLPLVAGLVLLGVAAEPVMPFEPPFLPDPVLICDPQPGSDGPRYIVFIDDATGEVIQEFDCPS